MWCVCREGEGGDRGGGGGGTWGRVLRRKEERKGGGGGGNVEAPRTGGWMKAGEAAYIFLLIIRVAEDRVAADPRVQVRVILEEQETPHRHPHKDVPMSGQERQPGGSA